MLTDAGEVMLKLNLSQLQHCSNVCDATLVPVLYFEPTLTMYMYYNAYICKQSMELIIVMPRFTCTKDIQLSFCVSVCVCVCVCNSDFSKVAKNQILMNAVLAQHDNFSNLIL